MGLFITFEGTDGVGKSTQIAFARQYLADKGLKVLLTREPGGCKISEDIRSVILSPENTEMCAECEALLYAAARAQHVRQVIRPALEEGCVVISDRFYDSSLAYQGYGRQLGIDMVHKINESALGGLMPDGTIFLTIPPEAAFKRKNGNRDDRIELSGDLFFERVYEGFTALAKAYKDRIFTIDASGSKTETQAKVRAVLDQLLEVEHIG